MMHSGERYINVERAVRALLLELGQDVESANLKETPRRVANFLLDHFPLEDQWVDDLEDARRAVFPSKYAGMVTETGIKVYGLCIHHLMTVEYDVAIGYLPVGVTIGLSKLARIAEYCLTPAGIQEDLTLKLSSTLRTVLGTEDVAVLARGSHSCMTVRGVKMHASVTTTSEMSGHFLSNDENCKGEFLQIVYADRSGR